MQGKIISFNEFDNIGSVIADDGLQYVFKGNNWMQTHPPKAGDNVDFTFNEVGSINQVTYQASHSQTNTPPNLSNNNGQQSVIPSLHKAPQGGYAPTSQNSHNHNDQSLNHQYDSGLDALYAEEEKYNLIDWTKKVIMRNYANFNGRARRKEYWFFYLGYFILAFVAVIIDGTFGTDDYGLFHSVLALALFIPSIAVTVRRLHDIGRSGWSLFWLFLPIIGAILLIIWWATDTSPETNRWGPPAKRL